MTKNESQCPSKQVEPLAVLATRIAAEHRAVEANFKRGLQHAIAAGQLLIEAKGQLGHGEWLPWLSDHCQVPERTAQLYMRVARGAPALVSKTADLADLTLTQVVGLLTEHQPTRSIIVKQTSEPIEIRAAGTVLRPASAAFTDRTETEQRPVPRVIVEQTVEHHTVADYRKRETDRQVDLITHYIRLLASTTSQFAGDLALIVDRVPADQRTEVAKQLADIQRFAALLSKALKQAAAEAAAPRSGNDVIH